MSGLVIHVVGYVHLIGAHPLNGSQAQATGQLASPRVTQCPIPSQCAPRQILSLSDMLNDSSDGVGQHGADPLSAGVPSAWTLIRRRPHGFDLSGACL